jgi:hypothetical protein
MSFEVDDMFGEPALLAGEDKGLYTKIYAAIEADIEPKSFFDRMHVREQTDKFWEELRLKGGAAALIDSAKIKALACLLNPIPPEKIGLLNGGSRAALAFYGNDQKDKQKVVKAMAEYRITEAMVQAKAMEIISGTLQLFDRMILNRENSRRQLRKEQEKRNETSIPSRTPGQENGSYLTN